MNGIDCATSSGATVVADTYNRAAMRTAITHTFGENSPRDCLTVLQTVIGGPPETARQIILRGIAPQLIWNEMGEPAPEFALPSWLDLDLYHRLETLVASSNRLQAEDHAAVHYASLQHTFSGQDLTWWRTQALLIILHGFPHQHFDRR